MAVPTEPVYLPGGEAMVRNVGGTLSFITDADECCCETTTAPTTTTECPADCPSTAQCGDMLGVYFATVTTGNCENFSLDWEDEDECGDTPRIGNCSDTYGLSQLALSPCTWETFNQLPSCDCYGFLICAGATWKLSVGYGALRPAHEKCNYEMDVDCATDGPTGTYSGTLSQCSACGATAVVYS